MPEKNGRGYKWRFYAEEEAKSVLARLQSILTQESNGDVSLRSEEKTPVWVDHVNNFSSALGLAGNIMGFFPGKDKKQNKIELKVRNNSDGIFIPLKSKLHKYYYTQSNLDICPPNQDTTLKISCNSDYNIKDGNIELTSEIHFYNGGNYTFTISFRVDNGLWYAKSMVVMFRYENRNDIFIDEQFPYNPGEQELSFFRVQHQDDETKSFGIAVFPTQSNTDEVRLNLEITPWRSKADDVL